MSAAEGKPRVNESLARGGMASRLKALAFFFFSSRRRHTRLQGDWSSDVCSSDLCDLPRDAAASYFAKRHPERRARVIARAGTICAHRFDLLGSGPRDLGPRLPWHADFKSGRVWPERAYFEDLRARIEGDFGTGSDVKMPWELSRFQHLPGLGQALWFTSDRRYYEEFRAQAPHWIA